jgi:protein AroM
LNDDDALFTRLPNGDGISLSKKQVVLHGAEKLAGLKSSGVDVVIMLCTGVFPEWQHFKGVLFPSRTLASMVKGCMPTGKVCVFAPLPRQCANTQLRWEEKGYEVVSLPLLPNATREEAMSAGKVAAIHDLDLIILDCISYTNETKRIIRETAGVPVILGISSAIRCALEMVE